MYIKKIEESIPSGKIANTHYEGQDKAYSCEYVNKISDYSTEEQVIGTFLGKPLYRKVINGISSDSSKEATWVLFANIPNLKLIHKIGGVIKTPDYQTECYNLPLATVISGNVAEVNFYSDTTNGNIYIKVVGASKNWFYGRPVELIVEYTKTTD